MSKQMTLHSKIPNTKINKNNSKTESIKSTIPVLVKTICDFNIGDEIEWTVTYDKNKEKWVAILEKAT